MADNYLEKKMNEHLTPSQKNHKPARSLSTLLKENRSYRGYSHEDCPTPDQLRRIVAVNCLIPSARNQQVLRFRIVSEDEAHKVAPFIRLGGALRDLKLPLPGTEPRTFIVICATEEESRYVDIDLGMSAQSMLLKAVEMGYRGICIGAFDMEEVQRQLQLPWRPILVIALGKGIEQIELKEVHQGDSLQYYRENGVHIVPKLSLDDLLIS